MIRPVPPLAGVIPILHTCYRADGSVDEDAVQREVDWVFATGAHGCGIALASDLLRLTPAERRALARTAVAATRGRGPAVISVGADTVAEAVGYARDAHAAGATALMAIPPRDGDGNEAALLSYYGGLAAATPLPLIVQDASSYVGRPMSAEFQAGLLDRYGADRIWFKPEADPAGPLIARLRALTGGLARCFEGSGGSHLVENHAAGIAGTMPGCDLLDAVVPLWKALEAGDAATVARLRGPVEALARLEAGRGLDGYLAVERYLMKKRGLFPSDRMRGDGAWTPDVALRAEVDRLFDRLRDAVADVL